MSRPRRAVAIAAAVCLAAIPTVTALGTADAEAPPAAEEPVGGPVDEIGERHLGRAEQALRLG